MEKLKPWRAVLVGVERRGDAPGRLHATGQDGYSRLFQSAARADRRETSRTAGQGRSEFDRQVAGGRIQVIAPSPEQFFARKKFIANRGQFAIQACVETIAKVSPF